MVCGTAVALDPEGSPGQVSLALEEEKLSYPHIKLLSSGVTTIQLVVVVQLLHRVRLFATPWPQHARLRYPSRSPEFAQIIQLLNLKSLRCCNKQPLVRSVTGGGDVWTLSMNTDPRGNQSDISPLLLNSHAAFFTALKPQTPPLILEASKVCRGQGVGKRRLMDSVYLFAAWRTQPGGVGRGQDGDTRQLSGSP